MSPKEKIDFKHDLGIYFSHLKKYGFLAIFILIMALFLEANYVVVKYLFKIIIDSSNDYLVQKILKNQLILIFLQVASIFGGILLSRIIVKWIFVHNIIQLSVKMMFDVKKRFFNHILHLSHDFHTNNKSGTLISRLIRGSKSIDLMNDIICFQFSSLLFKLIVVCGFIIYFDWVSALIIFLTVVAFIIFSLFIQNNQQSYNLAANHAEDGEKGFISDIYTNIDSVKFYGKEKLIKRKLRLALYKTKFAQTKHWNFYRTWESGHALLLGIGTFCLIFFAMLRFLNDEMRIGTIIFIFTSFESLIGPLFMFVFGMRNFYRAMADFDSLFRYDKIQNTVKDKKNAQNLSINEGVIEFKNLRFKYHKEEIFNDFNLKVKKNEKVALVGQSGCGKTTLVKLLYRLYEINEGEILIDGMNINSVKQISLRSEMAVVPQECILFDDTIINNIAFSKPKAGRDEVVDAMKYAQLFNIVQSFPEKEETIVGERGVKLSGGEKQRVNIARAILADKKIVVLDEATSSLDSQTEYEIQKDLERLLQNRTAIIIAHRLSTIMKADRIVVLEKGKIVQMGGHEELLQQGGTYKKLWELQKNGYIE